MSRAGAVFNAIPISVLTALLHATSLAKPIGIALTYDTALLCSALPYCRLSGEGENRKLMKRVIF